MSTVSNQAAQVDVGPSASAAGTPGRRWPTPARWLEALCLVLSPALAAVVLRLRLMAPIHLPDPAMHTIYLISPHDVFTRYAALYESTSRLREAGRVGFLVPARLADLAFGAVPGFFVTRYAFALIAVVPIYLLLTRLYGRPAGVVGVIVVLSSPVIVTAWGSDYPNSAVVSYAAGALACLAMPCKPGRRRAWLAAAGALLTLAVWAHGVAVPLVGATLASYVAVRLLRDRARLLGDLILLAGVAVAVTGLLIAADSALFGRTDFISLTWRAYRYLSKPAQVATWHSSNWRWAPYVANLLVPPAVLGAFAVTMVRRRASAVSTPVLIVGVAAAAQLAIYTWMQFFGTVQMFEEPYFASTLWASVSLVFALTVAELARPLADHPVARWLPAAVLLAVPLAYQADPHVPAFGWEPIGAWLGAAVIVAAAAARGFGAVKRPLMAATATSAALIALVGASLVLTVAPSPPHRHLRGTVTDQTLSYGSALGNSGATRIDEYWIATSLPKFVGPAAYPREQLMTWWHMPTWDSGIEYAGMYHGATNAIPSEPQYYSKCDRAVLASRRPAELLLFGRTQAQFLPAFLRLGPLAPVVVRTGVFRAGPLVLHVWLIRLDAFYRHPHARSAAAQAAATAIAARC